MFISNVFNKFCRKIITCGSNDGDIRMWEDISDDDPANFCVGETAVCCGQYTSEKKPRLIVAVDNTVQCFSFPSGDRDGVLLRFTASVSTIKINKKVSAFVIKFANCFIGYL